MRRLLLSVVGALAAAAGLCLAGPAAAAPAVEGTPVLGSSLLTPDQITAWYASTRITSTSPVPVAELAVRFIDEGQAQGVRGDIAFAQSMLETGYLRYGGIVKATDLNFSGLGACDSCPRGLAFASAEQGVRAQIQHLYAYAAPGADPNVLARPLADIRFTNVRPFGKAVVWEQMGNGNWATGPDYARKVLTIWQSMLTYSGIPIPGPQQAGGTPDLSILVSPDGSARLAGWAARRSTVADGIAVIGAPSSIRKGGGAGAVCLMRWDALGAAIQTRGGSDPCEVGTATMRWGRFAGAGWHTNRGLAPGDPVTKLRALYPKAQKIAGFWRLVSGRDTALRRTVVRLRAEASQGVVRALWVYPGPPS